GSEWSQEYREQLYRIGVLQRIIHANTLKLPESMQRATFMAAPAPGNNWINLGPLDGGVDYEVTEKNSLFKTKLEASDSGRPNQIVPHPLEPDTVYLVSAEGGLWKTMDSGKTWASLTEAQPSLALGALGIDPVKPSILYLGLGDIQEGTFGGTGTGMLKSTDGGKTWSDPPAVLGKSRAVTSILVFPEDTRVILVGTDAGLFRSKDSGATYQQISLPTGNPKTVRDILWIAGSRLVMTAGNNFEFGNGAGGANILTSDDAGLTWKPASGLGPRGEIRRFSLTSAPSDHEIVYALASSTSSQLFDIFKSSDGGATWKSTGAVSIAYANPIHDGRTRLGSLLGGQGGYNQLAAVDPEDPDVAYFGGNLNLVRTSDGGVTYTIISDWLGEHELPYVHADFHCAAFDGRGNLWVGNDGGVAKSTDGGDTWSTSENRGLPTHLVYSVGSSLSSQNAVILGMQDNGTRVRTGATSSFPQRIYADGFGAVIHPLDHRKVLGSAYYTRILKSTDGGRTFRGSYEGKILEAGKRSEAPFFTKIVPWTGDTKGNTVYTFVNSRLYKSPDFGDSWTAIQVDGLNGTIRNFGVAASDGQRLAVVSEGDAIHLSLDGGSTWQLAAGEL
ncbi:MAG: WD40/YVTN/BNR-like repeat-containing protein, partial [Thermoanaerobaculia bacterium]